MNAVSSSFLFFGLALLLFHAPVMWVKWARRGIVRNRTQWFRLWDKTDYLYLSLAALGVLPAANELQRVFIDNELNLSLSRSEGQGTFWPDAARRTLGHYEQLPPEARNGAIGSRLKEAAQTLTAGEAVLRDGRELIRSNRSEEATARLNEAMRAYDQFLSSEPVLDPADGWVRDVDLLRGAIQTSRDYAASLSRLNQDARRSGVELVLTVLAPYTLAFSLAVRVAKVTAKLLTVEEAAAVET